MDALLTIGEFSKMTYLSVKALRHYHDVGLLEPVDIDSETGYRRYSSAQVSTAQAIRRFRELDMPLEHVRAVLDAPDVTSRNEAILVHLRHMQQQLERTQTTVASLQALLEDVRRTSTVTRRSIGPMSTLAITETVGFDESGDWTTVNARVTYEPADGAWAVSAFGTNLTDEYMLNSGFFHGIWGYDFATVGRPREVGVSMNVRF